MLGKLNINKSLFILFLLLASNVFSQGNKTFRFGISIDNDSFASVVNDKYYTAGTNIFANYVSKNSHENRKIVKGFSLFQKIYNPAWVKAENIEYHNRPYAGLLVGEHEVTRFYKSDFVWNTKYQIGFVGPNSFAEEFQEWMHTTFNFGKVYGWKNQIQNAFVIQYNTTLVKPFLSFIKNEKYDFYWKSSIEAGTAFNSINSGLLLRVSLKNKIQNLSESNFFPSFSGKKEFYLFFNPEVNLQLYDATIQGSMFSNNSPLTYDIIPVRFRLNAGINYDSENLHLKYGFHYTTNEVSKSTATGYYYGTLSLAYDFK